MSTASLSSFEKNLPLLSRDVTQPVQARVAALVQEMTLPEKISQMLYDAPAIERLGVPSYNWWNECLHGVGRAGIATVFPQAIGLAATWNTTLVHEVATAISDEARAKHHDALARGESGRQYYGLTFWTPNINIFRDPRWGRGQETYGEDPYLTARMGVAFIRGLQGDDSRYLKMVATPKHFAVHSGPENLRHEFDAQIDTRDLWQTYLPAFEACVKEGQAASVMGAYNRTNGEPCCASVTLLQKILREQWGFEGYVVSDCGAIDDIYQHHKVVGTAAEAAALAVQNGCDLNCGETYHALLEAVQTGLIAEDSITQAVTRLFTARFRLGMFDPPASIRYAQIPITVNDSPAHRALARRAAQESIVLLKNVGDVLPLSREIKSVAVIGPNADDPLVLLGNYNGTPSTSVTPRQGIRQVLEGTISTVRYAKGCGLIEGDTLEMEKALHIASQAEVIIFVGGLSQLLEGEEGQEENLPAGQKSLGDRTDLDLPAAQQALLEALVALNKPVVLVLLNGSPIAINWAQAHVAAILEAWYPGEEGGTAIADVLFGDVNPAGRLPVTFPRSADDLPPFEDYRMQGRTYRYFNGEVLYPFGYGLSYTTFAYRNLRVSASKVGISENLSIQIDVQNTGVRAGDEVVQLYLRDIESSVPVPHWQLMGFKRCYFHIGETQTLSFQLEVSQLWLVDDSGRRVVEAGDFEIAVGGGLPNDETPRMKFTVFEAA